MSMKNMGDIWNGMGNAQRKIQTIIV